MGETLASRGDVSRLFGRAAFGATAEDLDRWAGRPYAGVVNALVDLPPGRPARVDEIRRVQLEETRAGLDMDQRWWLQRMSTTAYPLEERMTLFLHDHFATAAASSGLPDPAMLLHQNQTLRVRSLGNFRTLTEQITIDPAMLYWLNGVTSTKNKPNENYGRELFELFTLGTIPQVYTEADIRAAARALTGWGFDANLRQAKFVPANHDIGEKWILGQRIPPAAAAGDAANAVEYRQVVRIALDQPVAPRFLAYKLVLSFGYVPQTTDLFRAPDPLVTKVAGVLRANDWSLKEAVRTLLTADEFRYADATQGRQTVRQPIEVVVHAAKALGFSADQPQLLTALRRMGQEPFEPPHVSGWPYGKNWTSPTTVIARYDWGLTAYDLWAALLPLVRTALPASGHLDDSNPAHWPARLGLARLSPQTRAALRTYLSKPGTEAQKQAGVLALLMSSPDWMVM